MSSPLIRSTIQSCILAALSNLTAQVITAYRGESAYTINWTPILQFIIFNALNCPPNFLWQSYLESAFPSTYTVPSKSAITAAAENDEKELDREETTHSILETKLSIPNTLIKFLLDQTLGAALNTVMFSFVMAGFKGATFGEAVLTTRREFLPFMRAGWTVWPAVSALNFIVVRNVEVRQLVGSLAGFGWNVFLSLASG